MARDVTFHGDDSHYFASLPAKQGSSFFEELMAAPFTTPDEPFDLDIRELVYESVMKLDEQSKFVIEARYVWGKSFSEIADMLGNASKSTAYDKLKKAERLLKEIMLQEPLLNDYVNGKD
jgi:predicted DNA-binding protein YlxM (UPF0122 family)